MMRLNQLQKRSFQWQNGINLNSMIREIYRKFNEVRWFINFNKARNKAAIRI